MQEVKRSSSKQPHRIDLRQSVKSHEVEKIPDDWKAQYLRKHDWLCDIPEEYIQDRFNTFGLKTKCRYFNMCCEIINGKTDLSQIDPRSAQPLLQALPIAYGLIHQRYIMSPEGIDSVYDKYREKKYGTCPRLKCRKEPMVPIGLTLELGKMTVKAFCPVCREVYDPRPEQDLDAAYFGPNMVHIFLDECKSEASERPRYEKYRHTAFGFRVHNNDPVRK